MQKSWVEPFGLVAALQLRAAQQAAVVVARTARRCELMLERSLLQPVPLRLGDWMRPVPSSGQPGYPPPAGGPVLPVLVAEVEERVVVDGRAGTGAGDAGPDNDALGELPRRSVDPVGTATRRHG